MQRGRYDAVVVGSGPNGLAAAIVLARAGLSTLVVETRDTPGGGARTQELTLPGFFHDTCSSVHPLGAASPFFASLELERHGLRWQAPASELAHVLQDGSAVMLERSVDATAEQFGRDRDRYVDLVGPFVERFEQLVRMLLGPLRVPEAPGLFVRFGLEALRSASALAGRFESEPARALLGGIAAHSMLPLDAPATASFALLLACAGHVVGWPLARGGSQSITDALVACLKAHGGELECERRVEHLSQLPQARVYLLDVTPRQLLSIAAGDLSDSYKARLRRFHYGPGIFKMDWALAAPIPWKDAKCRRAATVHLSGSFDDVAAAERAVHDGAPSAAPFVLLVQPSLFDQRAPSGRHTAWAYCHVPPARRLNASSAIEHQIERQAPGFRDLILARAWKDPEDMERYNANYVGGDINGGLSNLSQLFFRPVVRLDPYRTSARHVFLCSSSTPPGGGVHGMCGYWAAQSALRRLRVRS